MFLEKLEIQGFKSFASKNSLVFPGMMGNTKRGITAVVGPNGSGKSNVADAVRWALGEQSMKTLRGKKTEDVIFSGSDKKGQLGMAEVSLHLNNEDKKAPIDYSQIVLTRRLYRNGNSEYLLNNSRVRLSDIQMLLAKASFGQKTYSVIGQGMVEGFLNTSLAERKEFFDEATGVKQYQIKRDESLNKLRLSYENLIQAQMLVQEIEPRIKSLTRQVNRLKRRGEIENELLELQKNYYSFLWDDLSTKFKNANSRYLEIDTEKIGKDKKMTLLNHEMEKFKKDNASSGEFERLQSELTLRQNQRNELGRMLAKTEAMIEVKLEREGKFDLSYLSGKREDITEELRRIEAESEKIEAEKRHIEKDIETLFESKKEADGLISGFATELDVLGKESVQVDSGHDLKKILLQISQKIKTMQSEDDFGRIKSLAKELAKDIELAMKLSDDDQGGEKRPNEKWSQIQVKLNQAIEKREVINGDINQKKLELASKSERHRLLIERGKSFKKEFDQIGQKITAYSGKSDDNRLENEREDLIVKIERQDKLLVETKGSLAQIREKEEGKRERLFSLQNELQSLQVEINKLSNELQTLKIEATRYETRLEDLETEIRDELGGLDAVKKEMVGEIGDVDGTRRRMFELKKQLELIGGIDPAVEEEYISAKDRYDFLTGQTDDLSKTIQSLEKIIKELDVHIKEKFDKEFKLIADKFEDYFKILFNGGKAKIEKVMDTEEKNTADGEEVTQSPKEPHNFSDLKKIKFLQKHNATGLAGVEIKATPPGKKIASVAMLSGGERALTAIALICAIISSNPSPFVVLDEVDAALDEANSERLAKILDELSHKTQFIVITHNRASMRKANVLYGVTMGDDGVSKLLSVNLEDVKNK